MAASRRRTVLTSEWCAWVAENVAGGVRDAQIIQTLVKAGVSRSLATRAVREIKTSPALHAVAALLRAREASEQRARLVRELARASPRRVIERRKKPTAAEFFERYWAHNQPVVFTNATKGWKLWTPADMKRLVGNVSIEVSDERHASPHYDENFVTHRRTTTIGSFVDRVLAAGETNDFYMVAQSKTMDRPEMRVLLERIVIDDEWFDPKHLRGGTSLWLGPKGTVTPFHHDSTNIFFSQIHGRKQFYLASPHETRILETARGYYAGIDPEKPDRARWPWWNDVALFKVVLEPGEVLFLPAGWWHHVRSLDVSISLSLLHFRRPNAFEFYRPGHA
jgi:hypothetical protein